MIVKRVEKAIQTLKILDGYSVMASGAKRDQKSPKGPGGQEEKAFKNARIRL